VPPEFDLRLYDYGASANCYKVRLLLAQLERPYERVPVDIFDGETLTDEYARINPLRSTPVLEVAPGRYLLESNAILVYLADGTTRQSGRGAAEGRRRRGTRNPERPSLGTRLSGRR
jgi:glutathione S-transferase